MNKEQWQRERRIWRAAISSISRSDVNQGLTETEIDDVWNIFWRGLYLAMPRDIYDSLYDNTKKWSESWGVSTQGAIRCNIELLRNSYPHRGRSV